MKVLISIIMVAFSFICKSQVSFPEPGMVQAVFYHGNIYQSPKDANRTIFYYGDTVMCGITYSIICQKYDWWTGLPLACEGYYRNYFRQDGNKIVFRNSCSNPELIYYDFGLNVGDTVELNFNTFNPTGQFIVDSTYTITLGGKQRKYLRLHGADQFSATTILRWIEGIGDIDRGLFCASDFEGGHSTFICHKENGSEVLSGNDFSFDCDSFIQQGIAVSITDLTDNDDYVIYPSIITDYFSVKNTSGDMVSLDIQVYNLVGQKILSEIKNTNEKIYIPMIDTGIYWVYVRSANYQKFLKVLKLN